MTKKSTTKKSIKYTSVCTFRTPKICCKNKHLKNDIASLNPISALFA